MSKTTIPAAPVGKSTPPAPPAPPVAAVSTVTTAAPATGFTIETSKAPPPISRSSSGGASAFPFGQMAAPTGDDFSTFLVPVAGTGEAFDAEAKKVTNRIMSALRRYKAHNAGQNFSVRKIAGEGVRVWRVADDTKA